MIQADNAAAFWVSVFDAACAGCAAAAAVYVAMRDSRWRKNGLAKCLEDQVRQAQTSADRWHETDEAKRMRSELDAHDRKIASHASQLSHVATKADLAKVEGLVSAAAVSASSAAAGVDRIEAILLKKALHPGAAA